MLRKRLSERLSDLMGVGDAENVVLASVADTHCNSTVGVNPPHVELVEGGGWTPRGDCDLWRWQSWTDYWEHVWQIRKEHKARLIVVVAGDALDDPHHATTQVVSRDKASILEIGRAVFERPRDMADFFFVVRGTVAHTGVGCWMEEELARDLEAVQDEESGTWSWWYLPMWVSGVLFDIAHHPATMGWLPWTQRSAAHRQSAFVLFRKSMLRWRVPDVVLRAHGHFFADTGLDSYPRTFYLRPWQTTTQHGHRRGQGGYVEPIGGLTFVCRGDQYVPDDKKFEPEEPEAWRMPE